MSLTKNIRKYIFSTFQEYCNVVNGNVVTRTQFYNLNYDECLIAIIKCSLDSKESILTVLSDAKVKFMDTTHYVRK